MTGADARFMALALALGARGLGRTAPNPAVGCVIVRDGRILGRGRTADGGRPHAETQALARAGAAARGATAYISLEPCAHTGATPPCAEALIAAGIARVVTALQDPDPRTKGQGHAMLRAAGIAVTEGVLEAEARVLHQGFIAAKQGRVHLTLKLASSFDGRIATATGESQWITGERARRMVHAMRARHDAVLVGGGTARQDDPQLTVRGLGDVPQPVRVVAARRLSLPEDGALVRTLDAAPLWLLHGAGDVPQALSARWTARGARLLPVAVAPGGHLDPVDMMAQLAAAGLTRVFCEGGGMLAASLLQAALVDELAGFTAGLVLGAEGQPGFGAMGVDRLAHAPRFSLAEVHRLGEDIVHLWRKA